MQEVVYPAFESSGGKTEGEEACDNGSEGGSKSEKQPAPLNPESAEAGDLFTCPYSSGWTMMFGMMISISKILMA